MRNDFKTLVEFLEQTAAEVSGRGETLPCRELREKIEAFMAGEYSDEEKAQVCEQIRNEPACLSWFAQRLKSQPGRVSKRQAGSAAAD